MNTDVMITLGCLVLYFALMIWAGFFAKGSQMTENSMEEFAVGGRNFSWVVLLFTLMGLFITASIYSSWYSWATYDGIFPQYLMVYSVFGFVFTYLFAKRIWIWGNKYKLLTQPDYIQLRYKSKPLTYMFGAAAVLIEAPWIIIEFAAIGYLMEAITYGVIPNKVGTIIVALFIIGYIVYSGMKALAVTEFIQGLLSSVVVIVGLIAIIYKLFGGFGPMFEQIMEVAPNNLTITNDGLYSYGYWSSVIITASLGIMGWASFFTRIYTSKSILDVKKVSYWSAIIAVVLTCLLLMVAMGGVLIPEALDAAATNSSFFVMADMAFGPLFMGLCAVVVVAAGMSLISVVLNCHSIIISENFIRPLRPNSTPAERVKIARISTLVYSLIALAIALMDLPDLYSIAIVAYECIAQIVPLVIFSIYWKRSNKWGAGLGFILGSIVTLYMTVAGISVLGFTGGMVGLVVNVVTHVACGYIFPKDEGVDELFEDIENYGKEITA